MYHTTARLSLVLDTTALRTLHISIVVRGQSAGHPNGVRLSPGRAPIFFARSEPFYTHVCIFLLL